MGPQPLGRVVRVNSTKEGSGEKRWVSLTPNKERSINILGTNSFSCMYHLPSGSQCKWLKSRHRLEQQAILFKLGCSAWGALELTLHHYPYMLIANFGKHLRMSLITPPAMHIILTSGSSADRECMISFIVIDMLEGGTSPSPFQIQIQRPGRSLHVNG